MDIHEIIRKKFDVREIISSPILCWQGSNRYRLLDKEQTRNSLAELFSELNLNIGVEVGVDRGRYSEVLCQKNPNLKLYCVDSWQGGRGRNHYKDAQNRLSKYNVELIRKKSTDAVKGFANESLDFVYIDAQRDFNSAVIDIVQWGRKIKRGGVISGRGYCNMFSTGIVRAVDAYTYAHDVKYWYITRELEPNYFMVKHWPER